MVWSWVGERQHKRTREHWQIARASQLCGKWQWRAQTLSLTSALLHLLSVPLRAGTFPALHLSFPFTCLQG